MPSYVPNNNPYYGSIIPYSSQPPPYSSTPTDNENALNVRAIEFSEFSTQVTLGGMSGDDEATPSIEDLILIVLCACIVLYLKF